MFSSFFCLSPTWLSVVGLKSRAEMSSFHHQLEEVYIMELLLPPEFEGQFEWGPPGSSDRILHVEARHLRVLNCPRGWNQQPTGHCEQVLRLLNRLRSFMKD